MKLVSFKAFSSFNLVHEMAVSVHVADGRDPISCDETSCRLHVLLVVRQEGSCYPVVLRDRSGHHPGHYYTVTPGIFIVFTPYSYF